MIIRHYIGFRIHKGQQLRQGQNNNVCQFRIIKLKCLPHLINPCDDPSVHDEVNRDMAAFSDLIFFLFVYLLIEKLSRILHKIDPLMDPTHQ